MSFSDLTGNHGEVLAFELVPSTFGLLAENVRRFPAYKSVYLKGLAVGVKHQFPRGNHGQPSLVRRSVCFWKDAENEKDSLEIETLRLIQYAERLGVSLYEVRG